MSRRAAGIVLLVCAAGMDAARYLTAAVFGSNVSSWNAELFQALLQYVGGGLVVWRWVLMIAGIVFLVWAEVQAFHQRSRKQDNLDS